MSTLIAFLKHRGVDTVIDVGANEGQFASWLRSTGYDGRIVSFEPIPAVFEKLRENASGDKDWHVRRLALGATAGRSVINVSRNSVFSSMLPLTDFAVEFDPDARVVQSETVDVVRLDDVFPDYSQGRAFLKIDTQGYEQAVLEGASRALGSVLGVQLELPVEHLYGGVWQLEDAISFMRRAGFVPAQISPVNMFGDDPTAAVEFDVVFRRSRRAEAPG